MAKAKSWVASSGLATAQRLAIELLGPIAGVRELRVSSVKHCEVGYQDMAASIPPWPRPLVVVGSGSTWPRAFAMAERALADPAVRAEVERHDELLAGIVARRQAERADEAAVRGPEDES